MGAAGAKGSPANEPAVTVRTRIAEGPPIEAILDATLGRRDLLIGAAPGPHAV